MAFSWIKVGWDQPRSATAWIVKMPGNDFTEQKHKTNRYYCPQTSKSLLTIWNTIKRLLTSSFSSTKQRWRPVFILKSQVCYIKSKLSNWQFNLHAGVYIKSKNFSFSMCRRSLPNSSLLTSHRSCDLFVFTSSFLSLLFGFFSSHFLLSFIKHLFFVSVAFLPLKDGRLSPFHETAASQQPSLHRTTLTRASHGLDVTLPSRTSSQAPSFPHRHVSLSWV